MENNEHKVICFACKGKGENAQGTECGKCEGVGYLDVKVPDET